MKKFLSFALSLWLLILILPLSVFALPENVSYCYLNSVNGVITNAGDATVCTDYPSWVNCRPDWCVSAQLQPTGTAGVYVVVARYCMPAQYVPTGASKAEIAKACGFTYEEGHIYIAVHGDGRNSHIFTNNIFQGMKIAFFGVDLKNGVINDTAVMTYGYGNDGSYPYEAFADNNTQTAPPEEEQEQGGKEDESVDTEKDIILGDINRNGEIDMTDYTLAKRAYFGTYNLDDNEFAYADVDIDNNIDMTDYILIKRAYFGTYSFE